MFQDTSLVSVINNRIIYTWISSFAYLSAQHGGINHVSKLKTQEHWLTEILSNHLSELKKECMRRKQRGYNLEGKRNWRTEKEEDWSIEN